MLGQLPTTININGVDYDIDTDYRTILIIIAAIESSELEDREKVFILLHNIYCDFNSIPQKDRKEAYEKAVQFIDCNMAKDNQNKKDPRTINWEKDEQLMFPAINKVAGFEVRTVEYMHWWTFLGYFQNIDKEDIWGYVLMLRQKKAKHKKLEKHEKEFWNANRALCEVETPKTTVEETNKALNDLFNELLKEGR